MSRKDSIKQIGISGKVVAVGLIITTLFAITTFAWIIPSAENAILERKKEKIKEATESAWSIMKYHQSLVDAGEMTLEQAQTNAKNLIKNMRFGPEMRDYFWINDMYPRMIMHPYKPALDGKSLKEFKDPNDVPVFVNATNICRRRGAGFVRYSWQWKDDAEKIVPKLSYVRLFRQWEWIVGTGMYIEDVRTEIHEWRIKIMIVSVVLALLGIFLSRRIGLEVNKRIKLLSHTDESDSETEARVWNLQSMIMIIIVPSFAVLTAYWGVTFYNDLTSTIMSGFDKKISAISTTTGCFIKGEDHVKVTKDNSEDTPLYQKYIKPMRRILKKTGLTYLYTQVLNEERLHCNYVMDGTEGEDHSDIGSKDELPMKDFLGAENVLEHGITHVGDVEATGDWGLIKVSYAPIYMSDNSINAMAGADVNIKAIADKTRTGLFAVGLLCVFVICGSGYVTYLFSRRFQNPIAELRDSTLLIAGGDYDHQVNVTEPKEFIRLSTAFNQVGRRLKNTLAEVDESDKLITEGNLKKDLRQALSKPWNDVAGDSSAEHRWMHNHATRESVSGYVCKSERTIVWLENSNTVKDPLKKRCLVASSLDNIIGEEQLPDALLKKVMQNTSSSYLVKDKNGISLTACDSAKVLVVGADNTVKEQTINGTVKSADNDWKWLIVSDANSEIVKHGKKALEKALSDSSLTASKLLDVIEEVLQSSEYEDQIFVSVMEVTA